MNETIDTPQAAKPYRVLARKYRPASFDDLIGQSAMVQTLSNAFRTGRIAQAYMLTGVRGVGKTTTARILARALNYKTGEIDQPTIDMDGLGEHCQAIMEGRHLDVIEMDAASHTGVDDVRDIIESGQYHPVSARYKVYIVDEVHMLSNSAFNALLKTLEEPPAHLKFIFATTEIRKVPVTVLSRCQRFDLRRVDADLMTKHLATICERENVSADEAALGVIARAAEGSVRDALSMLDQAISHGGAGSGNGGDELSAERVRDMLGLSDRARIVDLFTHLMKGDVGSALGELRSQYDVGADPQIVLTDLAEFTHLVTRLKYVPSSANDSSLSPAEREAGKALADRLSVRVLSRTWQMLLKGLDEVSRSERALPVAEMVLIRICHAADLPSPEDLSNTLSIEGGSSPSLPSSQPSAAPSGGGNTGAMGAPVQSQVNRVVASAMAMGNAGQGRATATAQIIPMPNIGEQEITQQETNAQPAAQEHEIIRRVESFDELIFLLEDKRDIQLKTQVRRHVRLVSFEHGRMEMNLVNNPLQDFPNRLRHKLEEWTGDRWMLTVSQKEGSPTLSEVEDAEEADRQRTAEADPTVQAIMAHFPGARVVDIRDNESDIKNEGRKTVSSVPDDYDDNP